VLIENHPNDSRVKIREDGTVQTLSSRMGTGGGNVPLVMEEPTCLTRRFSSVNVYEEGITPTLEAVAGGGGYNMPMVMESQAIESHAQDSRYKVNEINQPLSANMEHDAANGGLVMDNIQSIGHDLRSAKFTDDEITDPLTATDYKDPIKIGYNSVVRRLTPLECERLQGYPDGYTDIGDWIDSKGKKHKGEADSPRYKALGNSIALPYWEWMAERMVKYIDHEATMGSLFSGIGGFELVFARAGANPIWASEIEEFPIAVTRVHFGDDDKGLEGDYEKYL
jgi:DNA (cytosine-5)-methyltransferase 1